MLPNLPGGNARIEALGVSTSTTTATSPVPSTGVPGVWELLGTTSFAWDGFMLVLSSDPSNDDALIVDIGIGPSGSQIEIVSKLKNNQDSTGGISASTPFIPVGIPAGVDVWVRMESEGDAAVGLAAAYGFQGSIFPSYSRMVQVGYPEATDIAAKGTILSAPSSANTKGPYTQIVASTSESFRALAISLGGGTSFDKTHVALDLAIGPSGSEVVIVSNLFFWMNFGSLGGRVEMWPFTTPILPISIPAGTRIAARHQLGSINGGTDDEIDIIVHGFT